MNQLSLTARQILTEPALMSAPVGSPVSLMQMRSSHLERFGVGPHALSLFHEAISELTSFGALRSGERTRGDRTYFIEELWSGTAKQALSEALAARPTDRLFLSITAEEREFTKTTSATTAAPRRTTVHPAISGIGSVRD